MTSDPLPTNRQTPGARLHRSSDDKLLGGVAGGIAEYFGVDPVIVRIAVVLLTLTAGTGVVVYGLLWWLLPVTPPGTGTMPKHRFSLGPDTDLAQLGGFALLGLGALLVLDRIGIGVRAGVAWPIALIGIGSTVLWSRRRDDATTPGADGYAPAGPSRGSWPPKPPGPTTPSDPPPLPPAAGFQDARTGGDGSSDVFDGDPHVTDWNFDSSGHSGSRQPSMRAVDEPGAPAFATPRDASGRMERGPLGRIGSGGLLLGGGVIWLLDRFGAVDMNPERVAAAALIGLGAVLVLGSWLGRPRGFVPVGVMLTGFLVITSGLDIDWRAGMGERTYRPASFSAVLPEYRLLIGEMRVELGELDFAGRDVTIDASIGVGELVIVVPRDINVDLEAKVGVGVVSVAGTDHDGVKVRWHELLPGQPGRGTLHLTASAGAGQISVRRGRWGSGNQRPVDPRRSAKERSVPAQLSVPSVPSTIGAPR